MIARQTFKSLINVVVSIEKGITELEDTLRVHFDRNWMTNASCDIITAIANGFFDTDTWNKRGAIEDAQIETIEELLYHFIYMEDCGNDSEHCKTKLVRVSKDNSEETALSCTNLDELFNIILTYLQRDDLNFHFNYCHSHRLDDEVADEVI